MSAEEEISQLSDRAEYNRTALQELAVMRCKLICDGIRSPHWHSEASLKLNEQTMAVFRRALEISSTRLQTLETEKRLRAMGDSGDCG